MKRSAQSPARAVDVVVIGAGHCGLAISRCLTERSIEHVILERGKVANSWRHERWDSLRLLTPNWQSRLPGFAYRGNDPDGFMTAKEVAAFVDEYASFIQAPIRDQTAVKSVTRDEDGYRIKTNRGQWRCRALVIASGENNRPKVPALSEAIPSSIATFTAHSYRNPDQLPEGGVLVVGASATGLQIANEIHRSGRPVTIAVGEHVRMPRTYRGRDIQWWLDGSGVLDQRIEEVDDVVRARRVPSPQLVGTPERKTLDLSALADEGIEMVGRLAGVNDGKALFSGSLRNHCQMADLKLNRLLNTFDEWAERSGRSDAAHPAERYQPTRVPDSPKLMLDLERGPIRSVFWATGFEPDYSWLNVPALDRKGHIRHRAGVADSPGMYVMGLTFLRRRKSSFIHGAEDDARELTEHLAGYLDRVSEQPASAGCVYGGRWQNRPLAQAAPI